MKFNKNHFGLFIGIILFSFSVAVTGCGEEPSSDSDDDDGEDINDDSDDDIDDDAVNDDVDDDSDDDLDDDMEDSLSLLGPGDHIGFIFGFDEPIAENEHAYEDRWNEAIAAGMTVGRIQLDWLDLEPAPGVFNEELLNESLELLVEDGVKPMLTLSTLDSEELTFPEDLMEPDHQDLVDGMPLNDPVVLERFENLANWLVPNFYNAGGWLITVGNEVDIRSEDHPDDVLEIVDFVAGAVESIHEVESEMAVTVTLTASAATNQPQFTASLMELLDVACFNFYCQDAAGIVQDANFVQESIDILLGASGDLPLVIQELGCPAGYEDEQSNIEGTLEKQRAFFEAVWNEMEDSQRFRAAIIFQLIDWSPELTNFYLQWLQGMPQWFIDMYEESLRTMGLCRWEDGSERPAWDEFILGIEMFAD